MFNNLLVSAIDWPPAERKFRWINIDLAQPNLTVRDRPPGREGGSKPNGGLL